MGLKFTMGVTVTMGGQCHDMGGMPVPTLCHANLCHAPCAICAVPPVPCPLVALDLHVRQREVVLRSARFHHIQHRRLQGSGSGRASGRATDAEMCRDTRMQTEEAPPQHHSTIA